MTQTTMTAPRPVPARVKWLAGLAALLAALVLVLVFFPWDLLRGPLNRYVSERTGRHFEITRKLDVQLGRTVRIVADGIEFANPDWARDPYLVKAEGAQIDLRLWPLLRGRIELPLVQLREPQLGLQVEADGRRSWALGRDTSDPANLPEIGALVVDRGSLHFVAPEHGADIRADFAIEGAVLSKAIATAPAATATATSVQDAAAAAMPLRFSAKGSFKKDSFTAQGRTGNVLFLSSRLTTPFPAEVEVRAGRTSLRADGSILSVANLDGATANVQLQGENLADLYKLLGVVLPETPRYALRGTLSKQGQVWQVRQINGKLGNSDLGGDLDFDRSGQVPLLRGKLQSRALDFDDLAPLVGLPEQPRSAAALPQVAPAPQASVRNVAATERKAQSKVLPTATLDLARLKAMDADVHYSAAKMTHVRQLPLESMAMQIGLKSGVMQLDQLKLGVAGGSMAGRLRIDGNSDPALASVNLDARSLELSKLFPGFKFTQGSFGRIHGDIDLSGRGNSVAQMLGNSSGNVAMLMGRGEISNLLLEFAGLDGAEIIKFKLGGDRSIQLRCAATAFDVNKGLMTSRTLMIDTTDTVVHGTGTVNLATESLDLVLRPQPKDASILSLRSPLRLAGTFAHPRAGVDAAALVGRGALALALGAINPLLALAATIETGPGKDADCAATLREAAASDSASRLARAAPPLAGNGAAVLGAPPAPATSATPAAPRSAAPHYPLDKPAR
ncbi:AsmA family protein [uncultured Ramlibacter sp.]|uniref:AsmA family protein n=1 Tax=uncultured Ramlibacter sp. TaxID=260755 RepID=UPI0026165C84|nr:AsmA family protein [uncultured Ramlibacter sp.]